MKETVRLFKALSDETRLRIIVLLTHRELCVCQIEAILGLGQVKASRHLSLLRYIGLVNDRRQGQWIFYSLAEPRSEIHVKVLQCVKETLGKEESFKRDLANMKECVTKPISVIAETVHR
jgi:ArsR family transcriptional regulator